MIFTCFLTITSTRPWVAEMRASEFWSGQHTHFGWQAWAADKQESTLHWQQVWSITQFYSVSFFTIKDNSLLKPVGFFYKHMVCVNCSWRCWWNSAPRAAHQIVSLQLHLCSSRSNTNAKVERPWRAKSPSNTKKREVLKGAKLNSPSC